jgi:hypothetical protein
VFKLIRRCLDAGVMVAAVKVATVEGTPPGSPLSPLLANITLDDLDHEPEWRGHNFVRYADDLRVYVASERAAARVLDVITTLVARRLKLKVNRAKSGVAPATRRRNLIALGIPASSASQWSNSRRGYWHLAGSAPLARALPNRYWADLGLVPISDRVRRLRDLWRTAGCGPARPVVWEGPG